MKKIILSLWMGISYIAFCLPSINNIDFPISETTEITEPMSEVKGYVVNNKTNYNLHLVKKIAGKDTNQVIAAQDVCLIADSLKDIESISFYSYGENISPISYTYNLDLKELERQNGPLPTVTIKQEYLSYKLSYESLQVDQLISKNLIEELSKENYNFNFREPIDKLTEFIDKNKILKQCFPGLASRGSYLGKPTNHQLVLYIIGNPTSHNNKLGLPETEKDLEKEKREIDSNYSLIKLKWFLLTQEFKNKPNNILISNLEQIRKLLHNLNLYLTHQYKIRKQVFEDKKQADLLKTERLSFFNQFIAEDLYSKFIKSHNFTINNKKITIFSTPYDILGLPENSPLSAVNDNAYNHSLQLWGIGPDSKYSSLEQQYIKIIVQAAYYAITGNFRGPKKPNN